MSEIEMNRTAVSLSDSFLASGTDLEEFRCLLKDMKDCTEFVKTNSADLTYWVTKPYKKAGTEESRKGVVKMTRATTEAYAADHSAALPIGELKAGNMDPELLLEDLRSSTMFVTQKGTSYYVADCAMGSFYQRSRIAGEDIGSRSSLLRMAAAENLLKHAEPLTLTVRRGSDGAGKVQKKIFAFLSGKYAPIAQDILCDAVGSFTGSDAGTPSVRRWQISQQYTEIAIEFPEAAEDYREKYHLPEELVPGIVLMTSDTGDSCLTARSTYRIRDCSYYVVLDELAHRHAGAVDLQTLKNDLDGTLLPGFLKVPEALLEKMGSQVTPEDADLATEQGRESNLKSVRQAVRRGLHTLGLCRADCLGKERGRKLEQYLLQSVDGTSVYTEYALAAMFMALPDRIEVITQNGDSRGLPESVRKKLQVCCGKAAFISYLPGKAEADEELILLPEAE